MDKYDYYQGLAFMGILYYLILGTGAAIAHKIWTRHKKR